MTTSQKAALSLLITVILFGAFTALAFTGLFDLIETRFYNPSVTASVTRDLSQNVADIDKHLSDLQSRFGVTLRDAAVRRGFLPNQSAEDIFERSRIYGLLAESLPGFQWVRFIDSGGSRLHYSSLDSDVMQQDRLSVSYRNYEEPGFPYERVVVSNNGEPKFLFDADGDRILFAFPFYDSFDVYRGTALFSVSVKVLIDMLVHDGRIKAGQTVSVVSDPPGFLSGMSAATEEALVPQASAIWKEGRLGAARLVSPDSDLTLTMITVKTSQGFFVGRLVNEEMFSFPETMKIILLASFFLTVYLTTFLLFNLRQDSVTIVQNRLKQLQISLIEQYYEHKGEVDWTRWSRELEQRREEIGATLKRGVKAAPGRKTEEINTLIDKSWDELLSVMGGRKDAGLDEQKLESVLNRILAALPGTAAPVYVPPRPAVLNEKPVSAPVSELPEPEKFAALLDGDGTGTESGEPAALEDLEPLEEAESTEAGSLEEFSEAGEPEPLEEAGALEELPEAGPLKDETGAPPPEESEAEGEAEPLEEVPEAEPFEETLSAETVPLEEIPEPEPLEELGAFEETENAGERNEAPGVPESVPEEIPVIDIAETDLSAADADGILQAADPEEGIEELGELDEVDELENLENGEIMAGWQSAGISGSFSDPSAQEIANLASQIEFDSEFELEASEDELARDDLEIVSPFSTMLSDLDDSDNRSFFIEADAHTPENTGAPKDEGIAAFHNDGAGDTPDAAAGETLSDGPAVIETPAETDDIPALENVPEELPAALEEDADTAVEGLSLIHKPFAGTPDDANIETLDTLSEGTENPWLTEDLELLEAGNDIIEEREGVPYISEDAIKAGTEAPVPINRDFKNLVDSIIK